MTDMKERYNSPQTNVIHMDDNMTPICISNLAPMCITGEDYSIEEGAFDLDSDIL